MCVFVAGATGVIGTPLVPQLIDAGHEVTAMTRSVLRAGQLEAACAHPVVCDVYDIDGVRAAMTDPAPDEPAPAATPPSPYAPEMSMYGAANAKAKRELGWQPRYPSWREGFAASLQP